MKLILGILCATAAIAAASADDHGILLAQAGRHAEAIIAYRRFIAMGGDATGRANAYYNLAHAAQHSGRGVESVAAMLACASLSPSDASTHDALALSLRSLAGTSPRIARTAVLIHALALALRGSQVESGDDKALPDKALLVEALVGLGDAMTHAAMPENAHRFLGSAGTRKRR